MSASVLITAVQAEGLGEGGMDAPAFGGVRVADARLEETGALRRTIGAGHTGSRSSPVC
ncbi:MAG TPA: hypothetical protein VMA73_04510 [Streptosporangiaceae bacterium]|nr:hypothetical protein [Streptosporangiaceae bacterium]